MKKNLLLLLLILALPAFLVMGATAQESDAAGNNTSIEKRDGEKSGAPDREAKPSGKEGTTTINTGDRGTRSDGAKKEIRKKVERKKKELKKQPEKKPEEKKEQLLKADQKKEKIPDENIDRESGDSLLLIDHENIKYNRIPGITIKAEEPGQDLVRIPDDKIAGKSNEKKKDDGIFGQKTRTIAGWAIVICIFIIFAIYSKTRTRRSRRKGSRIITKR